MLKGHADFTGHKINNAKSNPIFLKDFLRVFVKKKIRKVWRNYGKLRKNRIRSKVSVYAFQPQ